MCVVILFLGHIMDDIIFSLHSWPQAILHIDGDAFFTSCEEVLHPELKGKPIITGAERGIVACASYAAKKIGIKRGVSLRDAKIICPGLVVLPSDYETYSLFSRRMFMIIRRFTPQVEEYSIDEASLVSLSVYNTSGEKFDLLVKELSEPGKHRINLDSGQLLPGNYICEARISKCGEFKQESKKQIKFTVIK